MTAARRVEVAGRKPAEVLDPALSRVEVSVTILPARDQHVPVRQEGGGVMAARRVEIDDPKPPPCGGVVDLSAVERGAALDPAGDQYLVVEADAAEQHGSVPGPGRGERVTGRRPEAGGGVIEFAAIQAGGAIDGAVGAPRDQDLARGQERGGVRAARAAETAGG